MMLALEMPLARRLVPLAMAAVVLLATLEMIRRRKLREEYAMLWLFTSAALLVFGIFPGIVIWLQRTLQVNYLTIIVLAGFLFLSLLVMHFAVVASRHAEQVRQLAQRIALLDHQFRELRDRPTDGAKEHNND